VGGGHVKELPEGTAFTVGEANAKGEIPIQPQQPIAGFEDYDFPKVAMDSQFINNHLTIDMQA
jgi:hypothetical protein